MDKFDNAVDNILFPFRNIRAHDQPLYCVCSTYVFGGQARKCLGFSKMDWILPGNMRKGRLSRSTMLRQSTWKTHIPVPPPLFQGRVSRVPVFQRHNRKEYTYGGTCRLNAAVD